MVNEETPKFKRTCEICNKQFQFKTSYQKHAKLYPYKHKFYKCCNSVEAITTSHLCKKKRNSKNIKSNSDLNNFEDRKNNENNTNFNCNNNDECEKKNVSF